MAVTFLKGRPINKNQAVNLHINVQNMLKRTTVFLIACLLMFCVKSSGQKIPQKNFITHSFLRPFAQYGTKNPVHFFSVGMQLKPGQDPLKMPVPAAFGTGSFLQPVPVDFYTSHLGIICSREWWLEKKTTIPLRIRVGSLGYTDYMEGKPNARPF